jgi:hypothetical protein
MLARVTWVIVLAGLAGGSWAQVPRPLRSGAVVPDTALYESFFYRVYFIDRVARDAERRGLDGGAALSRFQRSMGLSDQEMAVLRAVAADWRANFEAFVQEAAPWAEAARDRRDANGEPPPDLAPRLKALVEKRRRIVQDGIDRLKAAFGPVRFFSFDTHVRATSTLDGVTVSRSSPGKQ